MVVVFVDAKPPRMSRHCARFKLFDAVQIPKLGLELVYVVYAPTYNLVNLASRLCIVRKYRGGFLAR